jgi:FixJ family two-component response regulator
MAFTTYLVDDDPGVLKSLARLIRTAGYDSRSYATAREFLDAHDPSIPGCVVLDLPMPELDGLEVQQQLSLARIDRPVIFITGRGDIAASVQAMKAGAIDFLIKPLKSAELLTAISRAQQRDTAARQAITERESAQALMVRLTSRERQVLQHVIAGRLNKQIAATLGTTEKTIKVHRGRMMAKLGVHSVADLVRLAERAGIDPSY